MPQLTPFASNHTDTDVMKRGITICNTSEPKNRNTLSQDATGLEDLPLIRVARGNYSLWASNERWQCRWGAGNGEYKNDNNSAISEINAYSSAPVNSTNTNTNVALGQKNYVARVAVCTSSALIDTVNNEKCQKYGSNYKPTGVLHVYGEKDRIHFGLMTGSYAKNKSGGVLRKQVGSITDEINADGTFKVPASGNSIIKTIDLLRIYGYRFGGGSDGNGGTYHSMTGSDDCIWSMSKFNDGKCTNWGNPQAEIYLESLRYLAGLKSAKFDADDSSMISQPNHATTDDPNDKFTLNRVVTWKDPISTAADGNYCAPLNVLQFNASTTSYDSNLLDSTTDPNQLSSASDLGFSDLNGTIDKIGTAEGIIGGTYFIGRNGGTGGNANQICDAKVVNSLATVDGICPESPRLEGGYKIAGLAYLARKSGIATGREKVKTYGVALAPAVPKVTITVPGTSGTTKKTITILPACRNLKTDPDANCAIVDFKVVKQQTDTSGNITGKLYVNWEDSEQGGDFDQDMWGVISYAVTSSNIRVTTQVVAQSTGDAMGFGFVISGTEQDGFHVFSGANNFTFEPKYTGVPSCSSSSTNKCTCRTAGTEGACDVEYKLGKTGTPVQSHLFTIGTSITKSLQPPLYYAAKWGGYTNKINPVTLAEIESTDVEIAAQTVPDNYFYATDPRKLESSLVAAFAKIAASVGSAATVAANSTRLTGETHVYQAKFNSGDWSGQLLAYPVKPNGTIDTSVPAAWDTDKTLTRSSSRKIYTYDGASARSLVTLNATSWTNNNFPDLKAALRLSGELDEAMALKRFNWLLGSNAAENVAGGLRIRNKLLGDVVNSDPAYAGATSQRYNMLPAEYGSASYNDYVDKKKGKKSALFVGSNDGMMHAFNAANGEELFAYIPRGAYSKLAEVSKPGYVHQYIVDGPMYVGDVYFDSNNDGVDGEWRTIVAGTLGYGGKGAYALDVTDVLDSSGGPKVIFDVTAEDSTVPYRNDLGYSPGKILIVPTAQAKWTAIFGNGTDSQKGTASLVAIDIENPASYKIIDTAVGGNGLSGVALLPGGTGVTTHAYAGDLLGNMWKFNLTDDSMNTWSVAYDGKPLINVISSAGVAQPITATPTLGLNSIKKVGEGASAKPSVMVYFGTGKYYEENDGGLKGVQSIYGIADTGSIKLTKDNRTEKLHEKTISSETATNRVVSNDKTPDSGVREVEWEDKDGWFLDLTVSGNSATGERVLSKPLLLFDRVILSTFIPSSNQCKYGGDGWLMELTGVGDKFIGHSVLGANGNHILDNAVIGDLIPIIAGEKIHIIGSGLGKESKEPPLITIEGNAGKGTRGRMSWRQIK
ncbi:MAG TPA: PilC/PilY family type IV pilus protein [Cellvibrio sp.]|nr:PilC/PilY family type IV pilus protein [Cellvibrio sp.]